MTHFKFTLILVNRLVKPIKFLQEKQGIPTHTSLGYNIIFKQILLKFLFLLITNKSKIKIKYNFIEIYTTMQQPLFDKMLLIGKN